MDAMSSDACPVRMLSEGEYSVHTLCEGQTLFLLFFCMCLCCGWVHWHLLCWGWGETSGCPTLWGCSMVCIGKNIANCCTPNFFLSCARCARAVRALCTHAPLGTLLVDLLGQVYPIMVVLQDTQCSSQCLH